MYEYADAKMKEETSKYYRLLKSTGLTGEQLADLHRKAVLSTDKGPSTNMMAVHSKTLAYLTDIALQHIALGWEIVRE